MTDALARSCETCGEMACHKSYAYRKITPVAATTAFVVDEVWPEYSTYVAQTQQRRDVVLAPGLLGQAALARYRWPGATHSATWRTALRHLAMRQVRHKGGSARQSAYLQHDDAVAQALARALDYRAGHLVISQGFLTGLAATGALGGRSYDVLMTRYPLHILHDHLDAAAQRWPQSHSITDFRAPAEMVEAERTVLAGARRIITPHHGIAGTFAGSTLVLDWVRPRAEPRQEGTRVAFLGPVIARQGAYWVREAARALKQPLVVFGAELEGHDFWRGLNVEHRSFGPGWLRDIGAILHPAVHTNQPRRLLEAVAQGVLVFATPECGLAPRDYQPLTAFNAAGLF